MRRPQGFDNSTSGGRNAPAEQAPSVTPPVVGARRNGRSRPKRSRQPGGDTTTAPIPVAPGPEAAAPPSAAAPPRRPPRSPGASIRIRLRDARRERKRYEREEIRRFTRRARHRRTLWLSALGAVVLVVVAALLVSVSPLMALRTIKVSGTQRVDAAAVRRSLHGQLGTPMPFLDSAAIKADLAEFPLIRSYSTEVHPPGTLIVRVVERQPVGVVKSGSHYALVDPAGVVISRFDQRPAGHPLIAARPGTAGFSAAARVLQSLPSALAGTVDTATATTEDDVSFTLLGSGATVVWGSADKSGLKATILADLLTSAPHAHVYDLSSPHNVVTR